MLPDSLSLERALRARCPNQRLERTRSSALRPPTRAAQPRRWTSTGITWFMT